MQSFLEKLISLFSPLVKWWGHLHIPFTHKKINGRHVYRFSPFFKKGDILCSETRGEFSNIINPSKIKHGAIFYGTGLKSAILKEIEALEYGDLDRVNLQNLITTHEIEDHIPYVIEAIGLGVVPTDIITFMTEKDIFAHIQWEHGSDIAEAAAEESLKYLLWPYDYDFKIGNRKMYCFELCAVSYINVNKATIDPLVKEVMMVGEIKAYDYTTFMEDPENWKVVVDSRNLKL